MYMLLCVLCVLLRPCYAPIIGYVGFTGWSDPGWQAEPAFTVVLACKATMACALGLKGVLSASAPSTGFRASRTLRAVRWHAQAPVGVCACASASHGGQHCHWR